eukprot:558139-Pyramimonas_sp.AAC.1
MNSKSRVAQSYWRLASQPCAAPPWHSRSHVLSGEGFEPGPADDRLHHGRVRPREEGRHFIREGLQCVGSPPSAVVEAGCAQSVCRDVPWEQRRSRPPAEPCHEQPQQAYII